MAQTGRLLRSNSESNLSERCIERITRSKSLGDVQYSRALEEQWREELSFLKGNLDRERRKISQLQRENVAKVSEARNLEIQESIAAQNDLVYEMSIEKDKEIKQIKESARNYMHEKLNELEERKNEEIRRQGEEFAYEKEELINSLATRFREEARSEIGDEFEIAKRDLEIDYFRLVSENKKLHEDLKIAKDGDRNKAEEIRRLYKEYNQIVANLKKDASQDSRRQVKSSLML